MDYSIFAERERTGWADPEVTDGYVRWFGPVVDKAGEAHLDALPAGSRVLDLCCGQGTLTAGLVAAGHRVSGLDFSPDMLERAQKAAPEADLTEGDAQDLPYADGIFDAVVCNFGMMHIPDQPKAMAEVARVLKPGGLFSMTSWVGPEASDAFRLVLGTVRANLPEGLTPPPQPDLFLYGRPDEAEAALAASGLAVERQGVLPLAWEIDAPEDMLTIFLEGTVAARMMLAALDEAGQRRVAETVAGMVKENYSTGRGYRVPVPVAHIIARPA